MAIQVPGCLFVGLPAQVSPAMNTEAEAKESFLSFLHMQELTCFHS